MFDPLTKHELDYLEHSITPPSREMRKRAVGELRVGRAADRWGTFLRTLAMVAVALFLGTLALTLRGRPADTDPATPIVVCSHVTEQLRMARTFLARARPGDVEDALLVVGAVAPTAGFCRGDDAVTHALERAARGGDRVRSLEIVETVLRSGR